MKKYILDLEVSGNDSLNENYALLRLTDRSNPLPPMLPGQFVEVRVDGSSSTFLRRPLSINYVDESANEVWLLIHVIGEGTKALATLKVGDMVNVILPLGNGFTLNETGSVKKELLVGGGVGTAPMLFLGKVLKSQGCEPVFLLGARSKADLLQLDDFRQYGEVYLTTEDGSVGEKGYVTQHSILKEMKFDRIAACGPKPMMMAVAKYAKEHQIDCELSLENHMACGVGACLCCVEKTDKGNVCVCKDGPVFNLKELTWQI